MTATSNIPFDRTLALEISMALVLKLLMLSLIWWLWFAHPQIRETAPPEKQIGEKLFSAPPHSGRIAP